MMNCKIYGNIYIYNNKEKTFKMIFGMMVPPGCKACLSIVREQMWIKIIEEVGEKKIIQPN